MFQENGSRFYEVGNHEIKLTNTTIETLKFWDERYPNVIIDSKYLKILAVDVFGLERLALSSVYGGRARNAQIQHEPLDGQKLQFVQGNFIYHKSFAVNRSITNNFP